jgi:hypothetical protein
MTDDVKDFLANLKPDEMLVIARRRGDGHLILLSHHLTAEDAKEVIGLVQSAGRPETGGTNRDE